MKIKGQIRYLLSKQVLEAEERTSMQNFPLILKVKIEDQQVFVSDGQNSTLLRLKPHKTPNSLGAVSKVSDLKQESLYLLPQCKLIHYFVDSKLKLELESEGCNLVSIHLNDFEKEQPKLLEEDLEDQEVEQIRRRVF